VIGIVTGVLLLWCLLSLPIGLLVGRSLSIATQVEAGRRLVSPLRSLRSLHG
jgi:hypothetical protein